MSTSVSATSLSPGSWIARWGAWQINIRIASDTWHVRIWSCVRGVARVQLADFTGIGRSVNAVMRACEVLRQWGALVFIDGKVHPLDRFLAFSPTPEDILCS